MSFVTNKRIYEMRLHEWTFSEDSEVGILRVAGGWIYMIDDYDDHGYRVGRSRIFVPFNDEFKGKEPLHDDDRK